MGACYGCYHNNTELPIIFAALREASEAPVNYCYERTSIQLTEKQAKEWPVNDFLDSFYLNLFGTFPAINSWIRTCSFLKIYLFQYFIII